MGKNTSHNDMHIQQLMKLWTPSLNTPLSVLWRCRNASLTSPYSYYNTPSHAISCQVRCPLIHSVYLGETYHRCKVANICESACSENFRIFNLQVKYRISLTTPHGGIANCCVETVISLQRSAWATGRDRTPEVWPCCCGYDCDWLYIASTTR
jgi:hypothetical protein